VGIEAHQLKLVANGRTNRITRIVAAGEPRRVC
jgi:hypothetical protein